MKETQTGLVDSRSRADDFSPLKEIQDSERAARADQGALLKGKRAPLYKGALCPTDPDPGPETHCVKDGSEQFKISVASARSAAARPVVKWVGGKGRLVPQLLPRVRLGDGCRYFEPFAGGAALFFALAPERAVIADANEDLIATYEQLAFDLESVVEALARHQAKHSKAHYYATREAWNTYKGTEVQRAAAFLYLNRAGFNGLYRVNQRGELNVPVGSYEEIRFDVENLRRAAVALSRAELRSGDYLASLGDVRAGDFVYLDPPYDDAFNAYTASDFDQTELAVEVHRLVWLGAHVLVSNADTPLIRELYQELTIDVVSNHRSVSAAGEQRGAVDELLISNQPRKANSMGRQAELPGVESPDRIAAVEQAIYELLDAKTEASRVAKDARDNVKNKRAALDALFAEHKIDSHPYTCPKTNKPKHFWFTNERKEKTSSARAANDNDSDLERELEEPGEDTKVEMRRVPRKKEHDAVVDPFASTRSAMSDKPLKASIAERTKKPKGKRKKGGK